jgi:hypothetical protein
MVVLNRRRPILLSTVIVLALCYFGEPIYRGNDDPFLAMVGSGFGVATQPEPHLVWSHVGYGLVLGVLGHLVGPNAHGFITIIAIWLALTLQIRASLVAPSARTRFFVLVVGVGCVFTGELLSPEFTITAAVLFAGAIAGWLASSDESTGSELAWKGVTVLALILSYLIRPESYLMGLVIVLPALVVLSVRGKIARKARTLVLAMAIVGLAGFITDKVAYLCSPEWRHVPQITDLRAEFYDFHRVPWVADAPEYRLLGWTSNDYDMMQAWYVRHPIYDPGNLSLLVGRLSIPRIQLGSAQIGNWFSLPLTSWPLLLTIAAQLTVCLLLDKSPRSVALIMILCQFLAITAAALTGREPLDWVWCSAAGITLLGLCVLLATREPRKRPILGSFGLGLAGLLGILTAVSSWTDHSPVDSYAKMYRDWIREHRDYFKGKVTVWDAGLIWEWLITPLHTYPPFPELKVASIDDINGMPIETTTLRRMNIDDLANELATDPQARLICPNHLLGTLVLFCKQHYQISPDYKQVATFSSAGFYQLNRQTEEEETLPPKQAATDSDLPDDP